MIKNIFCSDLLDTGSVCDRLIAVRDELVNFYILKAPGGLICFDTGWRPSNVKTGFTSMGLNIQDVVAVFLTHLHWDHSKCLPLFSDAKVFVAETEISSSFMKKLGPKQQLKEVRDQETVEIAGLSVDIINSPGHTMGSASYLVDEFLFTGDALSLKHGCVQPFIPAFNKSNRLLKESLRRLADIKDIEYLLTSHSGFSRDPETAFSQWSKSTS